jgi:conjugal transfer pilus assembly protein TraF
MQTNLNSSKLNLVIKLLTQFLMILLVFTTINLTATTNNAIATNGQEVNDDNYCTTYNLGWHFYCNKAKKEEDKKEIELEPKPKTDPSLQNDYKEKLQAIQEDLENKKTKAVIYPTEENLKSYMQAQMKVINQAGFFADEWRRVLWKTPDLDYTLTRPASKIAKEAWIDERNKDVATTVKNINQRYGIFFLFRGSCYFCHIYAPILKSFKEKYDIDVVAISMDGGSIPGWENHLLNDKGQITKLGITSDNVPATLLFDKQTKQIIPIGYGVLAHSDLEERIFAITKLEVGDDF